MGSADSGTRSQAAGVLPCQGPTRSLPSHLATLLFIFIFCFAFYWHFLSSLLTVSKQIGTNESWENQLEPSHYPAYRILEFMFPVSFCLLTPAYPASTDILLYPPLIMCL